MPEIPFLHPKLQRWLPDALGRLQEPDAAVRRHKAPDSLIEFLNTM